MEYYIYHIPGVKIGMTNELEKRMSAQGFTEWEILETHTDPWLCGDRELELQKEYGLPVDSCHYMVSIENRRKGGRVGGIKGGETQGKLNRKLTFEQAEEIRAKYVPRKYSMQKLADEYNTWRSTICSIVNNKSYISP